MGGSQGSVAINSVVQSSIKDFDVAGYYVLHAVGPLNNVPASADRYRPVSYIENMADVYLAADLIIARSGAVTCSEFRTLGRYALFVPLPIGNGEQSVNAVSLVLDQRAIIVNQAEFNAEYLQKNLSRILEQAGQAPIEGNGQDMFAASKIVALAEFAIQS
jgi:UDP-N-acetylglucosamine--N-acetylmuramyl-(pentapeptide) pyrophosphoryl-undecaprenol N-acetylglucosamine transferase